MRQKLDTTETVHSHEHTRPAHTHGDGARLKAGAQGILQRGLSELLAMTKGLRFQPLPSEKYPLPLAQLAYRQVPEVETVRADVEARLSSDPVSVLEPALALLELYECNQADIAEHVLDDMKFIRTCFASKRANGWIAVVGNGDRGKVESAINARWQYKFFSGPARQTNVYALLSMLARYAYVYGRIPSGDAHAASHFIEDHTPGLVICRGKMSDLELTLSLAAMKMGVPAIVPENYPFPLGRMVRADALADVVESVVAFPNIRRLLNTPEIPQLPDYCDAENSKQQVPQDIVWGDTSESFYFVRKGSVEKSGTEVVGSPGKSAHAPMGVIVTIEAEPMDAFDRRYIERQAITALTQMDGVGITHTDDRFVLWQAKDTKLKPARIGEVLIATIHREWPKLSKVRVQVIFDPKHLEALVAIVRQGKLARLEEIDSTTEDSMDQLYTCVGCSPFAPDHVCVVTPQRPPQCNRPFEMIKTGALYAYDDMTNIHHSRMQQDINSFRRIEKGKCLDALRGEWEGVNAAAAELTQGRTTRVQLHCIDEFPHTGCGCFRLIMFKTDLPKPGIGIMDASYEGASPDGRTWADLHYALAGKQAPGMAGGSFAYLSSEKFLQAHKGWSSVVWISPKVAGIFSGRPPKGIMVGQ
jgi:CO dehydrogenase/acetyl-CoA synthase beta subunit